MINEAIVGIEFAAIVTAWNDVSLIVKPLDFWRRKSIAGLATCKLDCFFWVDVEIEWKNLKNIENVKNLKKIENYFRKNFEKKIFFMKNYKKFGIFFMKNYKKFGIFLGRPSELQIPTSYNPDELQSRRVTIVQLWVTLGRPSFSYFDVSRFQNGGQQHLLFSSSFHRTIISRHEKIFIRQKSIHACFSVIN